MSTLWWGTNNLFQIKEEIMQEEVTKFLKEFMGDKIILEVKGILLYTDKTLQIVQDSLYDNKDTDILGQLGITDPSSLAVYELLCGTDAYKYVLNIDNLQRFTPKLFDRLKADLMVNLS